MEPGVLKNLLIIRDMTRLVELFARHNEQIWFLKGLSYINEPEFRRRRGFADIDFLVEGIEKTVAILQGEGATIVKNPYSEGYNRRHGYHFTMAGGGFTTAIEPHWGIARPYNPFNLNPKGFIANCVEKKLSSFTYNCFCDEDVFINMLLQMYYNDTPNSPTNEKNLFVLEYILKNKKLDKKRLSKRIHECKIEAIYGIFQSAHKCIPIDLKPQRKLQKLLLRGTYNMGKRLWIKDISPMSDLLLAPCSKKHRMILRFLAK